MGKQLLIKYLLKPSDRAQQGFSMIEVLISILVTLLFLAGTLQLMGVSTLYKVLAKQEANANLWIQADIEEIQALASEITPDDTLCNPASINDSNNDPSSTLAPNSYATLLREQIEDDTSLPGATNKSLLPSGNGKQYRMDRTFAAVTTAQPNALTITYSVVDIKSEDNSNKDINKSSGGVIATSSTLVIPPASFTCD